MAEEELPGGFVSAVVRVGETVRRSPAPAFVRELLRLYVGLGPDLEDPADAARRVRLVADAYGLADRGRLVDTVLWWQDRCWRGIEAAAAAGDPAKRALRDRGVPRRIRAAHAWVSAHRATLHAALR